MKSVDLNCDLGEGAGRDAELMALVTSANIACGGHAGDPASMAAAIDLALAAGVAIGAHPGFEDREGFGRRERAATEAEVCALVLRQVGDLRRVALSRGARVSHVKPHGALYNQAARDPRVARAVARAVREVDPGLVLFGLAGGELLRAGRGEGLRVASEVFADRTYEPDGTLTPRSQPGAVITDEGAALGQVLGLACRGEARARDGSVVRVEADTVCVHGDNPRAVDFARRLRYALAAAGVDVRTLSCGPAGATPS